MAGQTQPGLIGTGCQAFGRAAATLATAAGKGVVYSEPGRCGDRIRLGLVAGKTGDFTVFKDDPCIECLGGDERDWIIVSIPRIVHSDRMIHVVTTDIAHGTLGMFQRNAAATPAIVTFHTLM